MLMISVSYRLRVVGWSSYEADDDDVSGLLLSNREQELLIGDGTYFVSSRDPSGSNSESVVSGTGESGVA